MPIISMFPYGILKEVEPPDPPDPPALPAYINFKGNSPFSFKVANETKNWDGTLEYSIDAETWSEFLGTPVNSGTDGNLYLRGSNNSIITRTNNTQFVFTGATNIKAIGKLDSLLDYNTIERGEYPVLAPDCYIGLFLNCTSLTQPPELSAVTLSGTCYMVMFFGCTSLKVSETQTGNYQTPWRIPSEGTGIEGERWGEAMLMGTGGSFTGDPQINTTYYLDIS